MITPRFKLEQTETRLTIIIRAPYTSLRNVELSVEENIFIFVSSPYYLRLHLPGPIEENEASRSSFDADSGEFSFEFDKTTPGLFPDLELITKFLCPKVEVEDQAGVRDKITILTGNDDRQLSAEELKEGFGFALAGKNAFKHVSAEFQDVFDVNPKEVALDERRKLRLQQEQQQFNADHYLSDFIEDEEIAEIIAHKASWTCTEEKIEFTDNELDFLKDLPNVDYKLTETQINYCHNCLVEIFYAYCYDRRTTFFEGSSESGWTIIKLASSLSWLDAFKTPKEALISTFRRSLIYPLYRNFALSQKVLQDLQEILGKDVKYLIKCLIEMHKIFLEGDCCRYIINNLFIRDYIVYVMKWDQKKWTEVVDELNQIVIKKHDLGLNLTELEEDICDKIGRMTILDAKPDDSDDDSSDSSSSSDSSCSSSE